MNDQIRSKIRGTLLGVMIGDVLGVRFEGFSATSIVEQIKDDSIGILLEKARGRYSDDTQMTIAMAESLLEHNGVDQNALSSKFVEVFDHDRGYSASVSMLLDYIGQGTTWDKANRMVFSDGSFGNGASMRISPVACYYYNKDIEKVWNESLKASEITHVHPDGANMAAALASAIHFLLHEKELNSSGISKLLGQIRDKLDVEQVSLCKKLDWIASHYSRPTKNKDVLFELGNSVLATESVFTAIFMFLNSYKDPEKAMIRSLSLGGDTDTITSMVGAMLGAYYGEKVFPDEWVSKLENETWGKDHILSLADKIAEQI